MLSALLVPERIQVPDLAKGPSGVNRIEKYRWFFDNDQVAPADLIPVDCLGKLYSLASIADKRKSA